MKSAKPKTTTKKQHVHTYAVEIWDSFQGRREIDVEAKNRNQAAAIVKRLGFEPRAVNMLD